MFTSNNLVTIPLILFSFGVLILLDITPKELFRSGDKLVDQSIDQYIKLRNKKLTIKDMVNPRKKKVKTAAQNDLNKKRIKNLFVSSLFLIISLIFANKTFLAIPLIYLIIHVPLILMQYYKSAIEKRDIAQLEKALSMITASYVRSKNVLQSVKENINEIEDPLRSKFEYFLWKYQEVNPSIESNLQELDEMINHFIAHEWFVAFINCKRDSSMSATLYPIVNKLSSIRAASLRLESKVSSSKQSLYTMVVLYFLSVPIFYFFDPTWVDMLLNTQWGNAVLAITATMTLYALKSGIEKIESNDYQKAMKGAD